MLIREAREQDMEGVLGLYRHLQPDEDFTDTEQYRYTWKVILNAGKFHRILVVEEGSELTATCVVSILPNLTRNQRPYMLIENVVTAPQYRRKGYGRALLQNAMDLARRHNCYKIMLLSNAGRKEAHGFYMSLGFEGKSKIGFQMRL